MQAIGKFLHVRQEVLVRCCHQIEMAIFGHQYPSFWGTMDKGEAYGDFEQRIMPADSNLLNSALAISSFLPSTRGVARSPHTHISTQSFVS
jgi:hypothetical protein